MKGFPNTVSIPTLTLFIEGVPRRGEGVLVNKAFTWQRTPPSASQPPPL